MSAVLKEAIKPALKRVGSAVALTLPQRAAVAMGTAAHEVRLLELVKASAGIVVVTNKDGREECHTAYMTLKNSRIAVEKAGSAATEDAKAFSKAVSVEAKRLIAITEAEEARLQALRDGFDAQLKAEKDAALAAELERTEALEARISDIACTPLALIGKPSTEIRQAIAALMEILIDGDIFEEYAAPAIVARDDALERLRDMACAAAEVEAIEAGRLADIAAEKERMRIAAAELVEQQRIAAIEAKRVADEQAEQRAELAEQARLLREQQDHATQIARELQEAAAAELKAAQDAFNAQQAEAARLRKIEDDEHAAKIQAQQDEIDRQNAALRAQADAHARTNVPASEAIADTGPDLGEAVGADFIASAAKAPPCPAEAATSLCPDDAMNIVQRMALAWRVEPEQALEWLAAMDFQSLTTIKE